MSDVKESQASVAGLAGVAAAIAKADIAVYGIAYDFSHFGSWTIEAGRRHQRLLLQWDGRERTLIVSTASVSDAQAQKHWKQVAERHVDSHGAPNESQFALATEMAVLHAAA
jgi:hypothetical protein